jgi:hypothetical protein
MSGDTTPIDHFIVFSEVEGIKAPIGTVLNLGSKIAFSFSDTKTSGIVGTKKYSVVPIFGNFTMGDESKIVVATREADITDLEMMT